MATPSTTKATDDTTSHPKAATYPPAMRAIEFANSAGDDEPRQGGKMCGCCCDSRRAVIIVNIIIALLEGLFLILAASGAWTSYFDTSTEKLEDHMKPYITAEIVLGVVSILFSILAIVGAVKFNIKMVVPNVLWLIVGFIIGLVLLFHSCAGVDDLDSETLDYTCEIDFISIVFALLWLLFWCYPHIMFISEVRKGIMTPETYPREKYSCCCV